MYKMVVSDFFGTLINSEEAIALSTMIELDRIRKEGVLFTITTSKSARVVADYNRDFPFIDYVVAYNGSYIYDFVNDKVLYDKGIAKSIVKKVYNLFKEQSLCFYTLNCCNYTGVYKDKDYSEMLLDIDNFIEENKKGIYKIKVCWKTLKDARGCIRKLKELKIKIDCYIKKEYGVYVVEITSEINSKLDGVLTILKKKKIYLDEVLAICSSISSTQLVKKAGLGCAVSNADNKLKKYAKLITSSNETKGVERVIKKYF